MLVDEQKELMRNLLFLSTNMAAMTLRENHLLQGLRHTQNSRILSNVIIFSHVLLGGMPYDPLLGEINVT